MEHLLDQKTDVNSMKWHLGTDPMGPGFTAGCVFCRFGQARQANS